jgi:rhodanese-related sulfurtransferase
MRGSIAPADLWARLRENSGELALLDVRGQGAFARGHILLAANAPLDRLEIDAPRLVPRRGAPVVLCDEDGADDGAARRAAALLGRFGYRDLAVLEGGSRAWQAAGLTLFEGVYVPSKAFGEFVEQAYGAPHIDAVELERLRAAGTDLVVLDSRPLDEYRQMCIPGGIDVPGAELVHRIHDLAPDPATLVVVNCAGRTRSIIGAQSLINAGVANRVVALENGTMGWTLAGLALEHGQQRLAPAPSAAGRSFGKGAAARVARRFGVARVSRETVARWQDEAASRTLFLCDVRSPEEYAAGHLPGARCTPGGQLVQATDSFVGTHGARLVLIDDDGVRATMTASWLVQIGRWEVAVLEGGLDGPLQTGAEPQEVLGFPGSDPVPAIAPKHLAELLQAGAVQVLDLADGRSWRAGHVPGARRLVRGQIAADWPRVPPAPLHVLTSEDSILARLAWPEATAVAAAAPRVLAGGTAAWRAAGLPLETAPASDDTDDVYLRPYDRAPEQIPQAMRAYLQWETALLPQLERDGTLRFARIPDRAPAGTDATVARAAEPG